MKKENIENEITELKKIKYKWSRTSQNRSQAHNLISEIGNFNHTFSVEFPNSVKHYRQNRYAEIHITDGISDLNQYAKSNLKQKDNSYFFQGLQNIDRGIAKIIMDLENEKATE